MIGNEEEINERSVLIDALEREEAVMASCSKMGRKLEPIPGFEAEFFRQRKKCNVLRNMIQAMQSEPVRASIADWQKDVMDGKRASMTVLDRVPEIEGGQTRMVF